MWQWFRYQNKKERKKSAVLNTLVYMIFSVHFCWIYLGIKLLYHKNDLMRQECLRLGYLEHGPIGFWIIG